LKNNHEYRLLSAPEIEILKQQGVSAADWGQILVSREFIPQNIRNVQFSGSIKASFVIFKDGAGMR